MFGIGKKRTKFGKWIDSKGITQRELEKESGINKNTMSLLCGDKEYKPKISTGVRVTNALKQMGFNKEYDDFWA